ncbi:hypothetical protein BDN67DRAFT_82774 [Paxillus ammoniavirescens]|nr:hypothetical protein BDN67DRAFT_82774 [Paxillus ammoniavirescens]
MQATYVYMWTYKVKQGTPGLGPDPSKSIQYPEAASGSARRSPGTRLCARCGYGRSVVLHAPTR